jgi:hypothetical protein
VRHVSRSWAGRWGVLAAVVLLAATVVLHLGGARAAPPPRGYRAYSADLAYQVVPASRTSCPPATACWNLKVRSTAGCPSWVRVEIAVARPDGSVVATAVDRQGPLPPGGTVLLRPRLPETTPGETGTLASLSCR